MSEKQWEDKGLKGGVLDTILDTVLGGPRDHNVKDTKTGEYRTVYVGENQTTGEAIENGQFKK